MGSRKGMLLFEASMLEMAPTPPRSAKRKREDASLHAKRTRAKMLDDAMNALLIEEPQVHGALPYTRASDFSAPEKPVLPDHRIHTSYKGSDAPVTKTAFEAANSRGINGLQTRGTRAVVQTQQTVADEQNEWTRTLIDTGQMAEHSFGIRDLQNNTARSAIIPAYESDIAIERANAETVPLRSRVSISSLSEEIIDTGGTVPIADITADCLIDRSVLSGFHGGNSHEVVATTGGQLNMRLTQSSQLVKPSGSGGRACIMKYTPDEYVNQSDETFGAFHNTIGMVWHEILAKNILESTPVPVPLHTGICGGNRMLPTRTYTCPIVARKIFEMFLRTPFAGETPCIKGDRCQGNMIHAREKRPLVSFYCLQMATQVDFSKITEATLDEIKRRFAQENLQLKMGYCIMCMNANISDRYYCALALGGNKAAMHADVSEPFPGIHGDAIINPYQVIVDKPGEFHPHDCIASAASPTGLCGFVPKHNNSMYTSVRDVCRGEPYIRFEMRMKEIPMSTASVFQAGSR